MSSEGSGEATGNSNSRKRSRRESDSQPSKKTKGNTKKSLISGKVKKKTGDDVDDKQEPVSSAAANSHTDEAIGKMDSRLLADFVAQKAQRHNDNLTSVELSDMYLPEKAFRDTSDIKSTRALKDMPSFLETFHKPSLLGAAQKNGCPTTIVVTSAGLRAADISRSLRVFQTKDSAVAKLFAKHIKLKDAVESTKQTSMSIGVGTPVRLADLLDSGALKLANLRWIVIDGSYIDQKRRGIFDMKETFLPLLQLLNKEEIRVRYGSGEDDEVQILVF